MWTIVQNYIQIERIQVRKLRQAEEADREAKNILKKHQRALAKSGRDLTIYNKA